MTRQYCANCRRVGRSTAWTRVSVVTRVQPSDSVTTRKFITTRAKPRPAERFEQRLIQRRHIPTVCAAADLGRRDDDRAEEQLAIRLFAQKNEPTCQRNVEDRPFLRRIEYVLALAISPWIAEKRERPEQNDVRRPNPPDRGEQLPRTGADAPLVVLAKLPFRQPLIDEHVASGGRTSRGREHGRAECEHCPGRCHEHSAPARQNADPAEGSNQTE